MLRLLQVLSVVPLFCGGAWIYNFGFAGRRAHLAYIGLPLGVVTFLLGIALLASPWIYAALKKRNGSS